MEIVVADTHTTSGTSGIFHRFTDKDLNAPGIGIGPFGYLTVSENPEIFVVNVGTKDVIPPGQRLNIGVPVLFLGGLLRRVGLPCFPSPQPSRALSLKDSDNFSGWG